MQRSSKGFGIIGVACAVIFLIVTAVVSASSHAHTTTHYNSNIHNNAS